MSEKITGVALLSEDGRMWSLPEPHRHHHLFSLAAFTIADPEPCRQGFTTNSGQFVGRLEARAIANAADQIKPGARDHRQLFSEDVW